MLTFDFHAIRGFAHGHRGVVGQQVHHHAFVGWIEMLDQNERHAVAGGQRGHEFPAGLKPAR